MRRAVLLLCIGLWPLLAQALEPGERLAPWTLLDQFDQPASLDADLEVLLVARSMAAGKLVSAALDDAPKGFLEQHHAAYVADISRMPAAVSALFAVPAMRRYGFRVLLDREARVAPRYTPVSDDVVWLRLDNGVLVERRVFADSASLRAALEAVR